MISTDMPFEFKRIQFPIRLAFAMTINKSQGQFLTVCGIDLENPCFSHGQLCIVCSRVGKSSALFVLALDKKEKKTKNVLSQGASMKRINPSASHAAQYACSLIQSRLSDMRPIYLIFILSYLLLWYCL